ncbi:PIN domain-containing protein [Streptomyces xylophagus]|uniref:PIN domain-containing protein n=1 Tax=Streptomyces xylophagus TaxID=285514 RepID=UPI00131A6A5A|nr:PIN domain-containing protein [Streptomyces xylophagus]
MRLKPGVTTDFAEGLLNFAERQWRAAREAPTVHDCFTEYLRTVGLLLYRYREAFVSPDLAAGLYNAAYWNLLALNRSGPGNSVPSRAPSERIARAEMMPLLTEIDVQLVAVEDAHSELAGLKRLGGRPGLPVVYDTNMLNHWSQPGDVDWREVLKAPGEETRLCRLIVPLTVIDELDRQKYGQGQLAKRAATAIRYLDHVLKGCNPGTPTRLREDATLEVWSDTDERGTDADLAILRCAADLDILHAPRIRLVWDEVDHLHPERGSRVLTDDVGMRLRANQMGLRVVSLPEKYRKPGTAMTDVPRT